MNDNQIAAILIAFAFLIAIIPAITYKLPVTQTDGATYYMYAKTYMETGDINAPNPPYNTIGSIEKKISDYPPFTIFAFAFLLNSGNDVFWINGGLGAIFFVIAAAYFFLLVKEMAGRKTALISLGLFVLNVRAYYTLLTGMYPAFISFCLTMPALYFAFSFLKSGGKKDLTLSVVFNALTISTYTTQGAFLIFIEIFMWVGMKMSEKVETVPSKIKIKIKDFSYDDLSRILKISVPSLAVFAVVLFTFTLTSSTTERAGWISGWVSDLISTTCQGYPCVWTNLIITDGPLFMLFAAAGIVYIFLKRNWPPLLILIAGALIVLSPALLQVADEMIVFVSRFYTTFYVLLIIPAAIFISRLLSIKQLKNIALGLITLLVLFQIVKLGYFYSNLQPAITEDEYSAAMYLLQHNTSKILYIHTLDTDASFRDFKWVVVYARSLNYDTATRLPDSFSGYDYIFVDDAPNLGDISKLSNIKKVFERGPTFVYSSK